jgi:hypothetical protein
MEIMSMKYKAYDFCKAVDCESLTVEGICFYKSKAAHVCNRTAKEFHQWLKENGFEIFKVEDLSMDFEPITIK